MNETHNTGRAQGQTDASEGVWFVYVLTCADGSLYTGITTDVARRVAEHLERGPLGARYTHAHPVTGVAAVWRADDRADASRLERAIKQLNRAQKDALVSGERDCGHEHVGEEEVARWWREASERAKVATRPPRGAGASAKAR